ncbi:hypothetical protein Ptr902_04393 [Pyrenophora tritici-repentis]|nr:hypothetical protein Ptr902_04393 [Pyrenophora tritici-repentis]
MFFNTALFLAAQAIMSSVEAAPKIAKGNWMELDCYVAGVKVSGNYTTAGPPQFDENGNIKFTYDWQLTWQTCKNTYSSTASYDNAKGRCIANSPDGIAMPNWEKNCIQQSINGWYDVDPSTQQLSITQEPYHADYVIGHGTAWTG